MEFRLNLASHSDLDRRTVRRWLLLVGVMAATLLAVNLGYGYLNLQQLRRVDSQLAELDARLLVQRDQAAVAYTPASLARIQAQIEGANQLIAADRFRWTALLSRLEELLPDQVAIRALKPNYRDRSLQVSAVAIAAMAMTEFLDQLLASGDLGQAHLLSHAPISQQDSEAALQFSLLIREAF
jgi:type IV pilus assembly protein PilN